MSIKGRTVSFLSEIAVATPLRSTFERTLVSLGHKYPTSRTVESFCRHFGSKLIEQEGNGFARVATFESGGNMFCGGEKRVAPLSLMFYFFGTIWGQHEDEQPVVRCFRRLVREGDVFFDLGANLGFYTCYTVPLCGKSGAVHAFEANPYLIPHLYRSRDLNGEYGNIHLNAVAVGKESGASLPLYDPGSIGCSSLYPHGWLDQGSRVLVPIVTIDEYIRENRIKRIDLMKIDIEGAELDALQGMEEAFRSCPPKVIICELTLLPEQSDPLRQSPEVLRRASSAADPQQLTYFLQQKGYELWGIAADGRLCTWETPRLTSESPLKLANAAYVLPEMRRLRPEIFVQR
jgi:FkbM family methyltransferase